LKILCGCKKVKEQKVNKNCIIFWLFSHLQARREQEEHQCSRRQEAGGRSLESGVWSLEEQAAKQTGDRR